MDLKILELFFPSGLLDYFEITHYKKESGQIHFYLQEKPILPEGYTKEELYSNGFYEDLHLVSLLPCPTYQKRSSDKSDDLYLLLL